jgi:hypothetical protein
MKYKEIILKCIECIETFNPGKDTIDTHSETFLE